MNGTSEATCDQKASPTQTDAGTLTVYYKATAANYNDYTGKAIVNISKADAEVTAAPTANTLTATGKAQELVTAGTVTGGGMQYALGKDAETAPTEGWSKAIPTAIEPGTYYVWYRAGDNVNYKAGEPKVITVTVENEKILNTGLFNDPVEGWILLKDGEIWKDYTNLYNDAVYGLWFVRNGEIDWAFTGLYNDAVYGWQLIHEGTICKWYNGLFYDQTYGWWLIKDGAVDFGFSGLYDDAVYSRWLIKDGAVDFSYSGEYNDARCGWSYIKEGKYDWDYVYTEQ